METILRTLGFVICVPWLVDAGMRRLLARVSRRETTNERHESEPGIRWLVVVPARGEGRSVVSTLESVGESGPPHGVRCVLLLDGSDDEAAQAARDLVDDILVKEPPGPTKGVVLRWLVEHHASLLDAHDAVVILDVGSRLDREFFTGVGWKRGSQAVQAWLRGSADGVGAAASLSERTTQEWQDRGRQALGWTVHLRGTGMVLDPELLREVAPRLWTSVEDTETTLLLAADGVPVTLAGTGAVVYDEKPTRIRDAAYQRSRWLFGKLSLLTHQASTVAALCARRPLEGLAFVSELLSRPYTLTGLFRLVLAVLFAVDGTIGSGNLWSLAASGVLWISLASDAVLLRRAAGLPWHRVVIVLLGFAASWCGAVLLLPRAIFGWARGRQK